MINRLTKEKNNPKESTPTECDVDVPLIWLNVPYAGPQGELLTNGLVRKLRRYLKKNTRIVVRHKSKYLSFLCSNKDKIPIEQRANVIYEVQCPGCGEKYIGKTDRCLLIRMEEHGTRVDQPMFRHLTSCAAFIDYTKMFAINLPEWELSFNSHKLNAVLQNYSILDYNPYNLKWDQLSFLEVYYIRKRNPKLNHGIKASKEFVLFKWNNLSRTLSKLCKEFLYILVIYIWFTSQSCKIIDNDAGIVFEIFD